MSKHIIYKGKRYERVDAGNFENAFTTKGVQKNVGVEYFKKNPKDFENFKNRIIKECNDFNWLVKDFEQKIEVLKQDIKLCKKWKQNCEAILKSNNQDAIYKVVKEDVPMIHHWL